MGQNRIAKNLNTVDLFTAPDKPAHLWRVQETLNRELNAVEPSEGKSSTALNQKEEFLPKRKRRGARGKQIASGCLDGYTKNKKLKSGLIATFPRVEGHRDPDNIDHWYWSYKYKEFVDGEWRNRSMPVPKLRITTVRFMIADGMSVAAIKALIKGEFANN